MRWKSHVRFGGRARETHQPKGWQGALVRPTTFGEDASRVRTGNAPAVLAAIRNIVTTVLRLSGAGNIAAARRAATLDPTTAIQLFNRGRNPDKRSL